MSSLLAIIAIFCLYPGLALSSSASEAFEENAWIVYGSENEAFSLSEESGGPESSNDDLSLSIIDLSGEEARTSLEISQSGYARLRLTPGSAGQLELFCIYPTGTTAKVINSSADGDKSYTTYFRGETEGYYTLWFTLDGARSNSVEFKVLEAEVFEEATPMASAGGSGAGSGIVASRALAAGPSAYSYAAPAAASTSPSIGFAAGGAKDISNFRENINNSFLPLPSDVTYEGLFYDYYFDTGEAALCSKLFCPSYSYAVSKDPFSEEQQYFLSVGLNSGIRDFQRKKLNLVVVLDYSGSMGSPFDEYYYDRFGNLVYAETEEIRSSKTKMQIADESVVSLIDHLGSEDRFGMVLFSDEAFLLDPLTGMADKSPDKLKERILGITETYGTNMEAGMEKASALLDPFLEANRSEYENRIIFLTDAMPNIGETDDLGLYRMIEDNADHGIYTTFIGIGVDFNSDLIERISKVKGANYYSVHSAEEFRTRMDDEFDFMVTPLVFDLRLDLDAPGYEIEKVYGSPEADQATGELLKVNTLFPSRAEEGEVRGGVVLVKLRKQSDEGDIRLSASYEDRNGTRDSDVADVIISENASDFYQNTGIRKAVLLSRYADLLKNWMIDERTAGVEG
ncbi:MAG: vWA domain-containing protein, partial [Methanothrix sp.]